MKRGIQGGMLRPLTREQILNIHYAALEVLEDPGVYSASQQILKIFDEAGADVDLKNGRVRIPRYIVGEALKKAPSSVMVCGRSVKYDILLERSRIYFGLGGTPTPYILDIDTLKLRRPTKKDVAEATCLGDALLNIDFIMSIAGAFDVPYEAEYLHEFEALFNNTEKPIVYSAPGGEVAKIVLKMAAEVAGGFDELRRRPILSLYSETCSPLSFASTNDNMIEFAKARIPVTLGPMPLTGGTAPITLAGCCLIGTAENLAAITLIQLVNPGAPVVYAGWGTVMDPRTGRCAYGAPEFALMTDVMNAQMAEFYGLPCYGFGGCSDSKLPDAQAGAEVMMNALVSALSGVNLIHDCGYLAGGSVGSMEMAVICNEVAGMVSRIVRGAVVDDESLAVDLIKSVGPGGSFLTCEHTVRFLEREIYLPRLFDRRPEEVWMKAGGKDIRKVAREEAKKILKEHQPELLPKDVQIRLSEIVKEAELKLLKKH